MRYDGKFLTFALHCRVLIDPLIELVERGGKQREKPRKPWLGVAPADENGQLLMFPMPMEQRKEYDEFARTLEHFLPENLKGGITFEHDWSLEFTSYEFYKFFESLNIDLHPHIEQLRKIGAGETLDDYMPLINFLGRLEMRGLHYHENERGGCF